VAFGIGLLLWPLTRTPRARERLHDPWIKIPAATSEFSEVGHSADNETTSLAR